MTKILLCLPIIIILFSCNNSTEPTSDSLRLILKADKTFGAAPLTINFSGRIEGDTEGITGQVPDYIFFPQIGRTIIPYSIPDTSRILRANWSEQETYPAGEFKVVLLYQGKKDGNNFNLLSDTLFISVTE